MTALRRVCVQWCARHQPGAYPQAARAMGRDLAQRGQALVFEVGERG